MSRAVSPVIGLTLLIGVTVTLGTVIGVGALSVSTPDEPPPQPVVVSLTASATDATLVFSHEAGPAIDVRTITLEVTIDGEPLVHQPPIPFFAASGFASGPTGPFNPSADPTWSIGETASLRLAGTNSPELRPGSTVEIKIHRDGQPLVRAETTAT